MNFFRPMSAFPIREVVSYQMVAGFARTRVVALSRTRLKSWLYEREATASELWYGVHRIDDRRIIVILPPRGTP
jgi:hypothetical protein